MDKRKPSEAVLAKKILLLRQKYKQQKKEERIFMKRNKKLVNEIQSLKETSKSLNDERLTLQKEIYDKKYAKAVSEENNIALKNSLSSFLNDLHALQTKVINSWRENHREGNRNSSEKPAQSCPQESVEEHAVSEDLGSQSQSSSQQDVASSQDSVLVYKVEALNEHEVEPFLTSNYDISESKEELSLFLSSFCRRDTVALDKPTGPAYQESENVPLERTGEPDNQESENVSLEVTCKVNLQESRNVPLEKTCTTDLQESENVSPEVTCKIDLQESQNVPIEKTCVPDYQESENVSVEVTYKPNPQESQNVELEKTTRLDNQDSENLPLERTCERNHQQLDNDAERTRLLEEPFLGFVEDSNEKAKFTEMVERLSLNYEVLDSLRNYEIAQSLTVFESNPEVTDKGTTITSPLEVELLKHFKIQQLEVSIPRLDLSAYPSLNSTLEIPKKESSRRRKSMKSTQSEDRNQRDTTPDSASESSNNGRALRRARNAVSYKEKPLKTKLRRS